MKISKSNINFKINVDDIDILDITKGFIVVGVCSHLSNYNDTVQSLIKRYSGYDNDLMLKTLNSNFYSTRGRMLLTNVTHDLAIVSIFCETHTIEGHTNVSFDAIDKGFRTLHYALNHDHRQAVYVPSMLGSKIDLNRWRVILNIINMYVPNAVILWKDSDDKEVS